YGDRLPAHYIQTVTCSHNGKVVLRCDWGIAISKNPYIEFSVKGGKRGDRITVSWLDNLGETQSDGTTVM
ncbi:MAG: thiosulfate oxidation carrier complex protein SoxZ, partial [Thiomonas sp.]